MIGRHTAGSLDFCRSASPGGTVMAGTEGKHDTILAVGFLCYDLIFTAPHYPEEDSLVRAVDYHKRRGGNASNSCSVLAAIGAKCEVLGPMTTDENGEFIRKDFEEKGILFHHCPLYSEYKTPFTSIVQSIATGTRTIIQYQAEDYPDSKVEDFLTLNLSSYSWIHFEGRGIPEVLKMINLVDKWNADKSNKYIPYSVELEKCTEKSKELIPRGDFIFLAKEFVKYLGYKDPKSALQGLAAKVKPGATLILPWGEQGALARCSTGDIIESRASPPKAVIDSTGAGDTFIGATIFYLSQNRSVAESIDFGNKIAGAKCGMIGYDGLKTVDK